MAFTGTPVTLASISKRDRDRDQYRGARRPRKGSWTYSLPTLNKGSK